MKLDRKMRKVIPCPTEDIGCNLVSKYKNVNEFYAIKHIFVWNLNTDNLSKLLLINTIPKYLTIWKPNSPDDIK